MDKIEQEVINLIQDRYSHYRGKIKFAKIAKEFRHVANGLITMDEGNKVRQFIYLVTKNMIRVEELQKNLDELKELLPKGITYALDADDVFIYLADGDTDVLRYSPLETLLGFKNIGKIIEVMKKYEELRYEEYFFADFYLNTDVSVRELELKYKEKLNEQ